MFLFKVIDPVFLLFCILVMISFMNQSGQFSAICRLITNGCGSNRKVAAVLATLFVGFTPIKNKSALAAPIMLEVGEQTKMVKERAAWVSFFGSHLHYMTSPLSASLLYALTLANVAFTDAFLGGLWITVLIWTLLTFSLMKFEDGEYEPVKREGSILKDLTALVPIVVLIAMVLCGVKFLIAVIAALVLAIIEATVSGREIPGAKQVLEKVNWTLLVIVAAATSISLLLSGAAFLKEIPHEQIFIYGFIISFLCGSIMPAAALAFGLFGSVVAGVPAIAAKLYVACFLGYMLSPFHNCIFITTGLFKNSLPRMAVVNVIVCAIAALSLLLM